MKRCPDCKAETVQREHEGVTADACPEGHGVWLSERELLTVVRTVSSGDSIGNTYDEGRSLTLASDHDVTLDDDVRTCPVCGEPMGSIEYGLDSGVVIDVCATHGVWLDAGELGQLEAQAEQRADPESPEAIAREERRRARLEDEPEIIEQRFSISDIVGAWLGR